LIYALTATGISVAVFNQNSPATTTFTALAGTGLAGNSVAGAIDATGQYLVAYDAAAKAASTFKITAIGSGGTDGGLTLVDKDSVTGNPVSFAFDLAGHYVVVSDGTANTVTAYSFSPLRRPSSRL
jgi:6-phosphogluconolactonase (cycloisomerase 2 family)